MTYYFALFNAVTDAINALERVADLLRQAQQDAEDLYVEGGD